VAGADSVVTHLPNLLAASSELLAAREQMAFTLGDRTIVARIATIRPPGFPLTGANLAHGPEDRERSPLRPSSLNGKGADLDLMNLILGVGDLHARVPGPPLF
jgi:hypothetical protein